MSTDRELLELAAKAAGVEIKLFAQNGTPIVAAPGGGPESCLVETWNPLTDDGDALRLANSLQLCVLIKDGRISVTRINSEKEGLSAHQTKQDDHDTSGFRRAIVRAAAEIGGKSSYDTRKYH